MEVRSVGHARPTQDKDWAGRPDILLCTGQLAAFMKLARPTSLARSLAFPLDLGPFSCFSFRDHGASSSAQIRSVDLFRSIPSTYS